MARKLIKIADTATIAESRGVRLERNVSDRVNVGRQTDQVIFVREITHDLANDDSDRPFQSRR